MKTTIVISGGCGFIGSNLARLFLAKYPNYSIIALDNLKRRGSEVNLSQLRNAGVKFVHGDIRNRKDLDQLDSFDLFIDAAAEPSVMAGINSSLDYLISTNLDGTINCLFKALEQKAGFIFLSTSRVYPIATLCNLKLTETSDRFIPTVDNRLPGLTEKGISEDFSLVGARSFYGATKLASELIVEEFHSLYGMKTIINRCGVIAGPHQMGKVDQGIVVHWMANHFWKQPLSYIGFGGQGKQVRDLLHIRDLFRLIDEQVHNLKKYDGKSFNVGGGVKGAVSLRELTELCRTTVGHRMEIGCIPETRIGDIPWFITDHSYITSVSGWEPQIGPAEIVSDIHHWIKIEQKSLSHLLINE